MVLLRFAQELFPQASRAKLAEIRSLIMQQIRKYMDSMNRGESDAFFALGDLRAIDRKILRRIVKLFKVGPKETQMDPLTVVDNLAKNAIIVHDLFAST